MAKVPVTDDPVPHGIRGYRKPWFCRCDICRAAQARYVRDRKDRIRDADELAARRRGVSQKTQSRKTATIGLMEQAVIDECAQLDEATKRPFVVASARKLARTLDLLGDDTKGLAAQSSTTKQISALIESLRPKETASKRKSGGRLATVGNLTKVRRAQ